MHDERRPSTSAHDVPARVVAIRRGDALFCADEPERALELREVSEVLLEEQVKEVRNGAVGTRTSE